MAAAATCSAFTASVCTNRDKYNAQLRSCGADGGAALYFFVSMRCALLLLLALAPLLAQSDRPSFARDPGAVGWRSGAGGVQRLC